MKDNYTSINVIIDRSGSMQSLQKDTIGGFNQFLQEQKELPGEATLTLCTFSSDCTTVHDTMKLADVPELCSKTYSPNGGTALLDAIGQTVVSVGEKLAAMQEEERPSKVLFLIITDGEENASVVFTDSDKVKDMVKHQQDVYKWDFVFMGANINSIQVGSTMGFSQNNTMNYTATPAGTRELYQDVSKSVTRYRTNSAPSSDTDFFGTGTK